MKTVASLVFASAALAQSWAPQDSGTTASLRGISAASATVVWASGSKGTFLLSNDGRSWRRGTVTGAGDSDFRAIRGFDEKTAYAMSIGTGESSRIYKTTDAGERWNLLYTNPDPKGFFDALAFWDASHAIVLGDPVDGHFVVMTTADGGGTWKRQKTPAALPNEGAFAASNSCLIVRGTREAWFGTGGGRVFHSTDGGATWSVAKTPVRSDSASAGIFSLAFSDGRNGVAVGGDYKLPAETTGNIAVTSDGGKTWSKPEGTPPNGFRSDVEYVVDRKMFMATGTSGSDISFDDGKTWKQFDKGDFNALSFVSGDRGWAVGPKGAIARLQP
jgi:photosystem II stability/assembly factor-like uncharacterized protein